MYHKQYYRNDSKSSLYYNNSAIENSIGSTLSSIEPSLPSLPSLSSELKYAKDTPAMAIPMIKISFGFVIVIVSYTSSYCVSHLEYLECY